MVNIKHLSMSELEARLDHLRESPHDEGELQLIVCRPKANERSMLETAELDPLAGLAGDSWAFRGKPGDAPNREAQLTIMNSRVINLVAQSPERWALAGDQLFVDLDLSVENLPAGTRLCVGSAVVEITAEPHLGCEKFVARFGLDAMRFVNSPLGRSLRLRGANARVVQGGAVRVGDRMAKLPNV